MTISLRLLHASALTLCLLVPIARGEAQVPARARTGSECGAPFTPSAKLKSSRVALPNTGVSVNLPVGWSLRQAVGRDGSPYFLVSAPPAGPSGMVLLAASDAEQAKSLEQIIQETGDQLTPNETGQVVSTRKFSLQRACGMQIQFRTPNAEGYIAALRNGARVYVLAARYPLESSNAMRGGLDTIVATAVLPAQTTSVAPVAANSGGLTADSIVGCWDHASEHTALSKRFWSNGTYESTSMVTGLPGAVEPQVERGNFRLQGNTLTLFDGQGASTVHDLTLQGGLLRLDGTNYTACDGR
ncbi:MAG TPA: hypothetical protein VJV78_42965 [Polyangiales bacterium]|nr:hypothetical protein [Polyangiales bacterium]